MDYFIENKRYFSSKNEYVNGNVYFYEGNSSIFTTNKINTRNKLIQLFQYSNRINILTNSQNILWYSCSDTNSDTSDTPSSCDYIEEFFYIILHTSGTAVFDTYRIYESYNDAESDMHVFENSEYSYMLLEICGQSIANDLLSIQNNNDKILNIYLLLCNPENKYDKFLFVLKNTKLLKRLYNCICSSS